MIITEQYLAGFFDGEGCVNCSKGRNDVPHVMISISGTCKKLLEEISKKYGGKVYIKNKYKDHHTQAYSWHVSKYREFVEDILPFTNIKTEQLKCALDFLETVDKHVTRKGLTKETLNKRVQIMNRIKELNK